MMYGTKPTNATLINDWAWVQPNYVFETSKTIKSVEIDPMQQMADIDRSNNTLK